MGRRIPKKAIEESLVKQLELKGADVAHFRGLINDYMQYYTIAQKMEADIRKNGLAYKAMSAAGKEYMKDNPNVKLLPQYTRSMLTILKELGLTTDAPTGEDELDGDL